MQISCVLEGVGGSRRLTLIMKLLVCLAIVLNLVACFDIETESHVRALYRVVNHQDNKFRKKGFTRSAYGGRWYSTIHEISLEYTTTQYRFQTIDEIRKFFIPLVEEYLQPLNEERSIRPYLSNFPFDTNNLELGITFYDLDRMRLQIPWICYVSSIEGKIVYFGLHPGKQTTTLLYSETFEEAKRILAEQNIKGE